MKILHFIIFFSLLITFSFSCEKEPILGTDPCDATGPIVVYKTKKDYQNNITVQLSKNNKEITAYPGHSDAIRQAPILLANGYLLKQMVGDAYLSITIKEYSDTTINWESKNLIDYVIDIDPYLEKYECCECTGKDTALINLLIKENRLAECKVIK
jgi:hypothetical protein